jgi:putative transposase
MSDESTSNYRRSALAGGTYFFTVALHERHGLPLVAHVDALREAVWRAKAARPFRIDASVVLPDHLHCVWTLPDGDSDYSTRWRDIRLGWSLHWKWWTALRCSTL